MNAQKGRDVMIVVSDLNSQIDGVFLAIALLALFQYEGKEGFLQERYGWL